MGHHQHKHHKSRYASRYTRDELGEELPRAWQAYSASGKPKFSGGSGRKALDDDPSDAPSVASWRKQSRAWSPWSPQSVAKSKDKGKEKGRDKHKRKKEKHGHRHKDDYGYELHRSKYSRHAMPPPSSSSSSSPPPVRRRRRRSPSPDDYPASPSDRTHANRGRFEKKGSLYARDMSAMRRRRRSRADEGKGSLYASTMKAMERRWDRNYPLR